MIDIKVEEIKKTFTSGEKSVVVALDGVSFFIKAGAFCTITGESGSGKSTLLHIIGGLEYPDYGHVYFNGKDIASLTLNERDALRNLSIGFIFQNFLLLKDFTVLENVLLPHYILTNKYGISKLKAQELLKTLGLEHRINAYPKVLSGGEIQRVAIARALINNPPLILADEPTGSLDQANQDIVLGLLNDLQKQNQFTLVMVTHNKDIAANASQNITLHYGKIIASP